LSIKAAPEYLRIHVNFQDEKRNASGKVAYNWKKQGRDDGAFKLKPIHPGFEKNRNPMLISEILDMTPYMERIPYNNHMDVTYELRHIVYHAGSQVGGGHYGASVTSAEDSSRKFFCNDRHIIPRTVPLAGTAGLTNVQTVYPVDWSIPDKFNDTPYDASIIFYELVRTPKSTMRKRVMRAPPAVGKVARRVKDRTTRNMRKQTEFYGFSA
jgi:hypothetical protein